jgi:two-component system sensor histidine kinase HydH
LKNIDDDEKLHEIAELKQKSNIANELSKITHDSDHHKISELEQQSIILKELTDEISEKNKQLEKINSVLERMSVIGELTSRLVHDLKNPLGVINMTTQMMKMETSDEKELKRIGRLDSRLKELQSFFFSTFQRHNFNNNLLSFCILTLLSPRSVF